MIDIVDRLKFDAVRCEMQFSKGVAGNIEEAAAEIGRLRAALDQSVKLQTHYAHLLNAYDGGVRMTFNDADAWLARLATLMSRKRETNERG